MARNNKSSGAGETDQADPAVEPSEVRRAAPTSAAARHESQSRMMFLRSNGIDPNAPLQLDIWPDSVREQPNDYARSALFTVRNKTERREEMDRAEIFCIQKQVQITYSGTELRADDDELIWLQILNFAKHKPLGEPIRFSMRALVLGVGWSVNARNYDRALDCISRLKKTDMRVHNLNLRRGVAISLIQEYRWESDGSNGAKYEVIIDPRLIELFAGQRSTRLPWEQYRALKPLARRLCDYAYSHRDPNPLPLDKFKQMCASNSSDDKHWRTMVRRACQQLEEGKLVTRAWVHKGSIYIDRNTPGKRPTAQLPSA